MDNIFSDVERVMAALYLAPGHLEEFAAEMGLTMPENIAALTAAGVHPVNWEELAYGG